MANSESHLLRAAALVFLMAPPASSAARSIAKRQTFPGPRDDVIDFVSQAGVFPMNEAVLAPSLRAAKNEIAEFRTYFQAIPARIIRARALAMCRMCPSSMK